MNLGIAIPTYNEATNIGQLLENIHLSLVNLPLISTTILVIDDNSPDGTAEIVKEFANKYNTKNFKIDLLARKIKNGLGRAYIEGFSNLLDQGSDFIIQMDADLSHDPVYLPAFIKLSGDNDLVVGSRYIPGGDTPDWPLSRRMLSKVGNFYARLILSNKISDYTGGYNMYSKDLLDKINYSKINSTGYGFLINLKYLSVLNAHGIQQIPIIFRDRQHGKSKLPKSTILTNLILVPKIRLKKLK